MHSADSACVKYKKNPNGKGIIKEDKPTVKAAIEKLTKDGVYSEKLWS